MPKDLMQYDKLAQQALRGVVRASLEIVKKDGLPGDHHFYIAFATKAPGVQVSDRLRTQHPDEMTIILQHQYWDLEVTPERFSITLSFNNVSETLVVPFDAVKGFYDPSVQFGLQFDTNAGDTSAAEASTADKSASAAGKAANSAIAVTGEEETADPEQQTEADDAAAEDKTGDQATPAMTGKEAVGGGEVVSLDAFRKK